MPRFYFDQVTIYQIYIKSKWQCNRGIFAFCPMNASWLSKTLFVYLWLGLAKRERHYQLRAKGVPNPIFTNDAKTFLDSLPNGACCSRTEAVEGTQTTSSRRSRASQRAGDPQARSSTQSNSTVGFFLTLGPWDVVKVRTVLQGGSSLGKPSATTRSTEEAARWTFFHINWLSLNIWNSGKASSILLWLTHRNL